MKNNKILLVILSLLIAISVYFITTRRDSTIKGELSDFAVRDTADITKIFLADRTGKSVTLQKVNGSWLLEGKEELRPDLLRVLLECIHNIQVRNKVAKAAYNNVVKMLATTGIKCEIYLNNNEKPNKVYYIGGHTEDTQGTFMLLENSSVPFVTYIPGFNGYLTPRYNTEYNVWRSPRILRFNPSDLRTLTVSYQNFPDKSFSIHTGQGRYVVTSPDSSVILDKVDTVAVENYLAFYNGVFYESLVKNLSQFQKDSILQYPPSIQISLDLGQEEKSISLYPMPISSASLTLTDSLGNPLKFDLDRLYGYLLPEQEFVTVQHYTFDKLFRQRNDFKAMPR